jgi:hypothetical protein
MTMFGLRRPGRIAQPHLDLAGGDPVLAQLRSAVSAGPASAVLSTLRGFAGYDLSALVRGVSDLSNLDGELPLLVEQAPADALPRLMLGARTIHRAWAVRSASRASQVSREQFADFHKLLEDAEEHLYEAARLDHASSAPWFFLLISGRGLQVGPDVSLRRFEAVTSREPAHFGAHRQRLQQLCKKWGGSHQLMHEFAREAMLRSDDMLMGVLVAEAHIEQWLDLGGGTPGENYMSTQSVRESLAEAASRSIDRADFASARDPYLAHNIFAFAFSIAGPYTAAKRAFSATRGVVTKSPWEYLAGDLVDGYKRWRWRATSLRPE